MYKVRDKADTFYTHIPGWIDLTPRLLVIGKSALSGKTTFVTNAILRDDMFGPYYSGDDIYIISQSLKTDEKLRKIIEYKKIPDSHCIDILDEDVLAEIWAKVEDEYVEAISKKKIPRNTIIIFDDISASGGLKNKKNGMISKIAMQGRHICLGMILTCQKLSDVSTHVRENCTSVAAFEMSQKQLDLLAMDHNIFPKKSSFFRMFNSVINEPRDFMIINYSAKTKQERFMDKDLKIIDWSQFL